MGFHKPFLQEAVTPLTKFHRKKACKTPEPLPMAADTRRPRGQPGGPWIRKKCLLHEGFLDHPASDLVVL